MMEFLPVAKRVVGLEIDGSSVKGVCLEMNRRGPRVIWARTAERSAQSNVNPLYTALAEILHDVKTELIVSAVPASDVLVRRLVLPVTKLAHRHQVLPFQLEPHLPCAVEETVLGHLVLGKEEDGVAVAVMSVGKEQLNAHLALLQQAGIEPERVTCPQAALGLVIDGVLEVSEPQMMLRVGCATTTLVLVERGKVCSARSWAIGTDHLMEVVDGDSIDLLNFDPARQPTLKQRVERFRFEVAKTVYSLTREQEVAQLFVAVDGGSLHNLDGYLAQALRIPTAPIPAHQLFPEEAGAWDRYVVAVGLALTGLPNATATIDFRQQEYRYPRPWRRVKGKLLTYFCLSLALSGCLLMCGKAVQAHQSRKLFHEVEQLAQLAGKGGSLPMISSVQEVQASAHALSRHLMQAPETFTLIPDVPQVSDLFAWLATHPQVVVDGQPLLQVEQLKYAMVRYPTLKKPKEHYQVKVEIEFTADDPTHARAFHDALMTSNPYVDPTQEVKWSTQRDRYQVGFILRDRTRYAGGSS